MEKYSDFKTIDEMFNNEGLTIETEEDFKALDEKILDKVVRKHTRPPCPTMWGHHLMDENGISYFQSSFRSWTEMLNKAAEEYMGKEIKKRF